MKKIMALLLTGMLFGACSGSDNDAASVWDQLGIDAQTAEKYQAAVPDFSDVAISYPGADLAELARMGRPGGPDATDMGPGDRRPPEDIERPACRPGPRPDGEDGPNTGDRPRPDGEDGPMLGERPCPEGEDCPMLDDRPRSDGEGGQMLGERPCPEGEDCTMRGDRRPPEDQNRPRPEGECMATGLDGGMNFAPGERPRPDEDMTGKEAVLWRAGRDIVREANGHIHHIMRHFAAVKNHRPTDRDGETVHWGPRRPDDAEYDVSMEVTEEDNGFSWQVIATNDEGATSLLADGFYSPASTENVRIGSGTINLYFDPEIEVRQTEMREGQISISFDNTADPAIIEAEYIDFKAGNRPAMNRTLYHTRNQGGGGTLASVTEMDMPRMASPGTEPTEAIETVDFSGIWNADGEARGLALASGGDLGDHTAELAQCTDSEHQAIWERHVIDGDDVRFEHPEDGEASCAFSAEEVPAFLE